MTLIALAATLLALGALPTHGKPSNNSIDAIPTVTSIVFQNGQLLASGNVTAVIKGKTFTKSFTGVPVLIRLAQDQTGATVGCPILDLELSPITVDLLGLVVETSPICLRITAHAGGGLLGDLLCSVGSQLQLGVLLTDILAALDLQGQLGDLLAGLTDLLNGA